MKIHLLFFHRWMFCVLFLVVLVVHLQVYVFERGLRAPCAHVTQEQVNARLWGSFSLWKYPHLQAVLRFHQLVTAPSPASGKTHPEIKNVRIKNSAMAQKTQPLCGSHFKHSFVYRLRFFQGFSSNIIQWQNHSAFYWKQRTVSLWVMSTWCESGFYQACQKLCCSKLYIFSKDNLA